MGGEHDRNTLHTHIKMERKDIYMELYSMKWIGIVPSLCIFLINLYILDAISSLNVW
jgi:hypothetical protein